MLKQLPFSENSWFTLQLISKYNIKEKIRNYNVKFNLTKSRSVYGVEKLYEEKNYMNVWTFKKSSVYDSWENGENSAFRYFWGKKAIYFRKTALFHWFYFAEFDIFNPGL
jgi:hypothetical protein